MLLESKTKQRLEQLARARMLRHCQADVSWKSSNFFIPYLFSKKTVTYFSLKHITCITQLEFYRRLVEQARALRAVNINY